MRTPLSAKAKVNVNYCNHEVRYLTIPCFGALLQDHHMLQTAAGLAGPISDVQPPAGLAGAYALTLNTRGRTDKCRLICCCGCRAPSSSLKASLAEVNPPETRGRLWVMANLHDKLAVV